ncbi:hypothetical protein dqs_0274 [Azoarcus olearius]|uniref:hypothetical protein n=1 Tax=Azoarcus sp. (strain BH72) TaxID=418699 RepID=UPI0008063B33|nr:hypothetical protein [Azoarcus olearius]ANQ83351.1 hypothetical protein dqs_0274 [Azoarcus olearius]
MTTPLRFGRAALAAVAFAAYLLLAHHTTASGQHPTLGALLAVVPYMAAALAMAARARHRGFALALWALGAALLWRQWPVVEARFEWVYLIQHVGTFGLLAIGFGRSLGGEPMITRFARLVHGAELAPPLVRYTRGATAAWALFFTAMTTASLLLFFGGPLPLWSLLVNILTPLLVALMFAAEFLVRRLLLPPGLRTGLVESVRACMHAGRRASPPAA